VQTVATIAIGRKGLPRLGRPAVPAPFPWAGIRLPKAAHERALCHRYRSDAPVRSDTELAM
jgi:hypothetical protein